MLIVLGFLILVVSGEIFLYFRNSQIYLSKQKVVPTSSPVAKSLNLPTELSTDFDPTQNSPVFKIESVDAGNKVLGLKIVWPKILEGTNVKSSITCKDDDIKILTNITKDGADEEPVTINIFFTRLQSSSLSNVLFSGLCSDTKCIEINKSCKLSMYTK